MCTVIVCFLLRQAWKCVVKELHPLHSSRRKRIQKKPVQNLTVPEPDVGAAGPCGPLSSWACRAAFPLSLLAEQKGGGVDQTSASSSPSPSPSPPSVNGDSQKPDQRRAPMCTCVSIAPPAGPPEV
ncbi:hypothetical protein SKAU_G00377140 [Synaphobranchus kaupii]|uniref:Uncharacterized protein n=1 Tax=Synaphobranchus kaupii TaxID=118154 RepID=A0A9Q1IEB9_SYNKA|nr:hypothetical protein SKAU_G00377140 [Synaphobranchus kaupii]